MKGLNGVDLGLYLVTDPDLVGDRSLLDVVDQAVAGGVGLVQLRDKEADARPLLMVAKALKERLEPRGVPLVVNDRVDVAAAAGVGCHIGQSDLPPEAARGLLGEDAIIGLSIDHIDQMKMADPACLDYVAHGPFAVTDTKPDAGAPVGSQGIEAARALTGLPLVAIGGIGLTNAADAIRAGADGIAVVSAIISVRDSGSAASALKAVVDQAISAGGQQRGSMG